MIWFENRAINLFFPYFNDYLLSKVYDFFIMLRAKQAGI